ncbi:hypothetical protein DFJ58DRAFT_726503 [Suillus subalutaceus]|uniref:uncharacterized protein n=1 Tax=Suillus subalutaceus TaxID=48586 RepID=UPI001B879BA7|nr:uncharacterized protein DFJ58DRAFT_726503 [Suillus subalutaceus]KAG1858726.1 hypothetical protein DFJ58DRAFT_726503 [Suillus subalutaceus]
MSVGNHYLPIIVVELVEGVTARKDTLKVPVGDFRIRDGMKVLIWTMMLYHEHSVAICPIPKASSRYLMSSLLLERFVMFVVDFLFSPYVSLMPTFAAQVFLDVFS